MNPELSPEQQRGLSAFFALLGAVGTCLCWHTALTEGYYYDKPAMAMPPIIVFGLAYALFPGLLKRQSQIAPDEDPAILDVSPLFWVVLALAILSAFANVAMLRSAIQTQ